LSLFNPADPDSPSLLQPYKWPLKLLVQILSGAVQSESAAIGANERIKPKEEMEDAS